ncbi:MAG: hypothetical protein RLZZ628_1362 [Bacteroidota bacterium]|jgi:hypothetical protein
MVTNLAAKKLAMIAFIMEMEQEEVVLAMETFIQQFQKPKRLKVKRVSAKDLALFSRPTTTDITVESIVQQQAKPPLDAAKIDAIIRKMAITEPVELLLSQLKP